jgi:RNA polymerase sigma-70 factor (ECF subfamily)
VSLDTLINECKKNDRKAQERLYKIYASKLYTVALKYSRNIAEAEDNLQEAFLIIFNKISQFNFKGSFEGWAKRIVMNQCLQQYRGIRFLDVVHENIAISDEIEIEEETISIDFLMKIIRELPDQYRLVFNLYVLDGYSHKEIGKMLHISDGTSKSNLARARMILRQKIVSQTEIETKNISFPSAK